MITHVVFFKFKAETSAAEIKELEAGLKSLPQVIAEIREFRCGADVIRSERSYDFGLVSAFEDLDAMQRYQVHPEHQKVVSHAKAISASIVAVDFEE